jgi:poly(A) polymerase
LRKDVQTDGRHAKVEFSLDWKEDSARRDFSINSIYSDGEGNLFDPNNGKQDLDKGLINFIGDTETRIKEDYLRILRYIRFFLNYSKHNHDSKVIRIIKRNIDGISQLSSERLLDEFRKLTQSVGFIRLFKDKDCLEIIEIIFPQFKNLSKIDFIFLLSLMIIDGTDNTDYFFYKFRISKKDQKRLKLIDLFYKDKSDLKKFTEKNFNKIFYYDGKQAVDDIINFKLFTSTKVEKKLIKLMEIYKDKVTPTMPIGSDILMNKYNIPEGKILGNKLKMIEEIWVSNNFNISEKQLKKIVNN